MLLGLVNTLAFSLAAMSLGYFVCIKASKEQGFLKLLGLILGAIIIASALFLSVLVVGLGLNKPPAGMARQQSSMGTRPMMPAQPVRPVLPSK